MPQRKVSSKVENNEHENVTNSTGQMHVQKTRSFRKNEVQANITEMFGRGKRKATDCNLTDESGIEKKHHKKANIPDGESLFTPRRSPRGIVPNRQFKDMEVEYKPGKRQDSKKATEKTVSKTSSVKVPSKRSSKVGSQQSKVTQKTDVTSSEEIPHVIEKEGVVLPTMLSNHFTLNSIKEDQNSNEDGPTAKQETILEGDTCGDKNVPPEMKIADSYSENCSQDAEQESNSDIVVQTFPVESEPSDYSIIREEDLERITSELLELAQNAEQEHSFQSLLAPRQSNNPEFVSSSFTVTDMKLVEVPTESGNSVPVTTSCVEKQSFIELSRDPALQATPAPDTVNMKKEKQDFQDSPKVFVDNRPTAIVIENIMQKQTSVEMSDNDDSISNNDIALNKRSELSELGNGMHEMETEIQQAVKNALLVLTEKTAEIGDVDTSGENEKDENTENIEGVSSSGTQTAKEIIKLPALNPKSRLLKTVRVVVKSDKKSSSDTETDDKTDPRLKQEFVIVHVPDGQMIKRTQVRVTKPEDSVPFTIDEKGMYKCGVCNYETYKKANLYKHRKKHVDDKPHCCPYCNYKTATSSNLKRHISIHQDVRSFQCELCNMSFRQKIHLERHVRYRHEEKKVKCPLCDYVCANENPDLKVHMKRRHLPLDAEDGSYQAFKCEECGLVTLNKKDFRQHMKFHRSGPELKLFCDFCSFVTDCESRLKRHSFIHSKERPFQCGVCDYRGSQREHVVRHMRSQHGIELPKRRKGLDEDGANSMEDSNDSRDDQIGCIRLKSDPPKPEKHDYSSQEKIFACNHCSMKFSKLLNLYKHLHAQHKDILPDQTDNEFLCVVCDFKTTTKKNLLVHMRKHNQIDQIPPSHVYSCVLCNYINPKRRNLFQHMKKKHGIEIVMKDDGSTSCFVADANSVTSGNDQTVQNLLTVGDMVTTQTDEQELQIVTEEFERDGIHVQNVISFDDIAYAASHPQPHNNRKMIVIDQSSLVQEHEAAEAIEGLQALAEQPGIVSSQEVITDSELMTADDNTEVNIDNVSRIVSSDVNLETSDKDNNVEKNTEGIQLSADEVMNLSAGDFVEINGEMYKVEISDIPSAGSEIVATTS